MYVKYIASIGSPKYGRNKWLQDDNSCFEVVNGQDAYAKEVWFFHETAGRSTWLSILGHEKAAKDKEIKNRMWVGGWIFHICVGGKGYYNDIPVTRGTCFLSWPYIKHSFVADKDDPLEFYWLIMSGPGIIDFAVDCGFADDQLVYTVDRVDEIVNLFEQGFNTNYSDLDVYSYTMGLARMILSYPKPSNQVMDEQRWIAEQGKSYTKIAKSLLKNSNYTLSIAKLSERIGISSKHLSRVFYNDTNQSLKQYIVQKKFEFATKLLKKGISPTEVAFILEYQSYAAFSKMFIARCGMTPTKYIESLKNDDKIHG